MRYIFLFLLMTPGYLFAQSERKGWHAGVGLGSFNYNTHYYYHNGAGTPYHDNYPGHSIGRTMIIATLEKKTLFPIKRAFYDQRAADKIYYFDFDLGAELLVGPFGKTTGDWLPENETISSGGIAAGINAYFRSAIVIKTTQSLSLAPFLSLGPQLTMIQNNGKGLGSFASRPYYNYKEGWTEYVLLLNASLGVGLEFPRFAVTPEIRFGVIGTSSTDWEPDGGSVDVDDVPGFWAVSIKITRKL